MDNKEQKTPAFMIHIDKMRKEFLPVLEGYLKVLEETTNLTIEKVNFYGDDRYHITDWDYDSKMLYSDIYRKWIRLKQMIWKPNEIIKAEKITQKDLMLQIRETFRDMLNYCAMGVQLIDMHLEKGDINNG